MTNEKKVSRHEIVDNQLKTAKEAYNPNGIVQARSSQNKNTQNPSNDTAESK